MGPSRVASADSWLGGLGVCPEAVKAWRLCWTLPSREPVLPVLCFGVSFVYLAPFQNSLHLLTNTSNTRRPSAQKRRQQCRQPVPIEVHPRTGIISLGATTPLRLTVLLPVIFLGPNSSRVPAKPECRHSAPAGQSSPNEMRFANPDAHTTVDQQSDHLYRLFARRLRRI